MLLRNSALMNDFSEVRHGWECLKGAYNSSLGERLRSCLSQIQEDLPEVFESNFNDRIFGILNETYLMSMSEHGDSDGHEDHFGRLSMWRAYAPKNGIAFILNNAPFVCESNALGAYTSPVNYAMPDEFNVAFEEVICSLEQNIGAIAPLGGHFAHEMLMTAFRFAVQSTKHPSFKEEKEWRVIYCPNTPGADEVLTDAQRSRVPSEIISLGGVPQRVYSISFTDYPDEGFVGATPPALIDRILVGPSSDSNMIAHAFVSELQRLNVPDAESRVIVTGIPLRQ